jgi:Lon protease-like protein
MASETTVHVDFSKPVPLFPLDKVSLLPHGVLPLNVFEPRYRQMVTDTLDGSGLIAMAVFAGQRWMEEYHGRPPVRPAVCIGHLMQHLKQTDGTYLIILQGVCRARIAEELPASDEKLYRRAMLEPVGLGADDTDAGLLRDTFADALETAPLSELRNASALAEHLRDENLPTSAVLELVTMALIDNIETRYRLLESAEPIERAKIVSRELKVIARLLRMAQPQKSMTAPKGVWWN